MNIFLGDKLIDCQSIGQVITMMCRVKDPESKGWIEPKGQTLQRVDYPLLYDLFKESEDIEFNKLIINDVSFKLPNYTARYLRNHGVANSSNNGGGGQPGLMYGDAIRNIVGSGGHHYVYRPGGTGSGALYQGIGGGGVSGGGGDTTSGTLAFDAARVVPTASENRVFTANVVYYIKAR